MDIIGNMYPIPDKEIENYINRILEDFKDEQFNDFANNEYTYTDKIKQKIKSLSDLFAEKKFKDFLDTDKVFIKPSFQLPKSISPGETSKDITKSLYEKEGNMNGFEERVINEIGNMTISVKEHSVFPETTDEELKDVFGMSVTMTTTAKNKKEALVFFEKIGFPFKKEMVAK